MKTAYYIFIIVALSAIAQPLNGVASAQHPDHESICEAHYNPALHAFEVALRVDALHFEAAVTKAHGQTFDLEHAPGRHWHIATYLKPRFQMRTMKGREPCAFRFVGHETEDQDLWIYFEMLLPPVTEAHDEPIFETFEIRHRVMLDHMPRQNNLVNLHTASAHDSCVFTAAAHQWQELELELICPTDQASMRRYHIARNAILVPPQGIQLDRQTTARIRRLFEPIDVVIVHVDTKCPASIAASVEARLRQLCKSLTDKPPLFARRIGDGSLPDVVDAATFHIRICNHVEDHHDALVRDVAAVGSDLTIYEIEHRQCDAPDWLGAMVISAK